MMSPPRVAIILKVGFGDFVLIYASNSSYPLSFMHTMVHEMSHQFDFNAKFSEGGSVEGGHLKEYETMTDVLENLPKFMEAIYNRKRLHSSIGYKSPEAFEKELLTMAQEERPLMHL